MTQKRVKQVLYKANSGMGCTVNKGDIIGVDVIAEDKDSGYKLVLSPPGDQYECASMFLVKPAFGRDKDYYVHAGGEEDYINISRALGKKFQDFVKS